MWARPTRRAAILRLCVETLGNQLGMFSLSSQQTKKEIAMLYYALVFLVVALIAGVLGFGGIAGASASIAQVLFFIFLVLFIVSLVARLMRRV
jgi:uncharacterized membrane protein YtjA (UPF0391 family)